MKYIVFFILTTLILNTKVSSQPFVRSWYTTWGNDSVPAEMNFVNQCADDFGNVYTHLTKDTVWNIGYIDVKEELVIYIPFNFIISSKDDVN